MIARAACPICGARPRMNISTSLIDPPISFYSLSCGTTVHLHTVERHPTEDEAIREWNSVVASIQDPK